MKVYASIRNRPTWITGWPQGGWHGADPSEPGARRLPFHFDLTDDGDAGFLLVYDSADGVLAADTWHQTLADPYDVAESCFGIRRPEWMPAERD